MRTFNKKSKEYNDIKKSLPCFVPNYKHKEFVKIETIEKLINHSNNFDITIAQTSQRTHNLCGVFSNNLNETIEKMIKNDIHKINYLVKNSKYQIINFDYEDEFLNINEKKEYEKALNIIN